MPGLDALLDRRQAASMLHCSVKKVDAWTQSGELPAIRLGPRMRRYRPSDLAAFVERTQAAQAEAKEALLSWSRRKLAS